MSNVRIIHKTPNTTIVAVPDPADQFGASHVYEVRTRSTADGFDVLATITFQKGPIKEHGVNGVQHDDLLAVIRDRLDSFQEGPFASTTNAVTRGFVDAAMASEGTRTRLRERAGVEGTSQPDVEAVAVGPRRALPQR